MNLPKKVKIPTKILKDRQYNAIIDFLSDTYGFCINSFEIKKGYAIDIDWDTTD